jgi:hypothetical protein
MAWAEQCLVISLQTHAHVRPRLARSHKGCAVRTICDAILKSYIAGTVSAIGEADQFALFTLISKCDSVLQVSRVSWAQMQCHYCTEDQYKLLGLIC